MTEARAGMIPRRVMSASVTVRASLDRLIGHARGSADAMNGGPHAATDERHAERYDRI